MNNILAIDVGGSGVKLYYEKFDKKILTKIVRQKNLEKIQLIKIIDDFIRNNHINPEILGISQTGTVQDNILVDSMFHPHLNGISPDTFQVLGIPKTYIINDGLAMVFAAHKTYKADNIMALTVGKGIGIGILNKGKIEEKKVEFIRERVNKANILTGNGNFELWKLCCGTAITKKFGLAYMLENRDLPEVQEEIRKVGRYMGKYIMMANELFYIPSIYLTGGAIAFEEYFQSVKEYCQDIAPDLLNKTMILKSTTPFFDGCIGVEWYVHLQENLR